ncbi:hypothetical protein SPRG_09853 [Saprolegnia parasitica CBS 223.65]|uniref:Uncharacterized protein n=1 Tax=Saprolegnia parasitica (strain CBS 223.65) TaxID=695850 RepID=A0A067C0E5_SAPPC|nr:hypothetical protein SPRG_09853 [Saprolegnia parasitica CBS 223.65]KDO24219.1 hypothetical protein SPRG_09853 [Saprolegnia parasitica CBS 223.65]|eukprot:XP_012204996.1 hypothetical protein SPRG_09853 [Saprolegnia parasitica CBS 223.65]
MDGDGASCSMSLDNNTKPDGVYLSPVEKARILTLLGNIQAEVAVQEKRLQEQAHLLDYQQRELVTLRKAHGRGSKVDVALSPKALKDMPDMEPHEESDCASTISEPAPEPSPTLSEPTSGPSVVLTIADIHEELEKLPNDLPLRKHVEWLCDHVANNAAASMQRRVSLPNIKALQLVLGKLMDQATSTASYVDQLRRIDDPSIKMAAKEEFSTASNGVQAQYETLAASHKALQAAYSDLQAQYDRACGRHAASLETTETQLMALHEQETTRSLASNEIAVRLETAQADALDARRRLVDLEAQLSSMTDNARTLQAHCGELEAYIEYLTATLETSQADQDRVLCEQRETIEALEDTIAQLRAAHAATMASLERDKARWRREAASPTALLGRLKTQVTALQRDIAALKTENARLRDEGMVKADELAATAAWQATMKDLVAKVEVVNAGLLDDCRAAKVRIDVLESEKAALQANMNAHLDNVRAAKDEGAQPRSAPSIDTLARVESVENKYKRARHLYGMLKTSFGRLQESHDMQSRELDRLRDLVRTRDNQHEPDDEALLPHETKEGDAMTIHTLHDMVSGRLLEFKSALDQLRRRPDAPEHAPLQHFLAVENVFLSALRGRLLLLT